MQAVNGGHSCWLDSQQYTAEKERTKLEKYRTTHDTTLQIFKSIPMPIMAENIRTKQNIIKKEIKRKNKTHQSNRLTVLLAVISA